MPQARMNRRQQQRARRANKFGYWAPPVGHAYPGKPVYKTNLPAIALMLKALADRDHSLGSMEREAIHRTIDEFDLDAASRLLIDYGFKQVKHKELRVEKAKLSSSAGLHPGQAAKPGGASGQEYITRLTK